MKPPVLLRVYLDDKLIDIKQFTGDQFVIGNRGQVHLDLDHPDVSSIHAVIEERSSYYYITDLGSLSGTTLNGEKILDSRLKSEDQFQIGPYRIEFFIGLPKPKAPPAELGGRPDQPEQPKEPSVEDQMPELPPKEERVVADVPVEKLEVPKLSVVKAQQPAPEAEPEVTPSVEPESEREEPPLPTETAAEQPSAQVQEAAKPSLPKDIPDIKEKSEAPKRRRSDADDKNRRSSDPGRAKRAAKGTYAPDDILDDLRDEIRPAKGTTLEIIVTWQNRILSSHHFDRAQSIRVGTHPKNDIVLPFAAAKGASHSLVDLKGQAVLNIPANTTGEVYTDSEQMPLSEALRKNGMGQGKNGQPSYALQQGEVVRLDLQGGVTSLFIRFAPEAPKPLVGPFLNISTTESVTFLMALIVPALFYLYMFLFTPLAPIGDEGRLEEQLRRATVTFKPPKRRTVPLKQQAQDATSKGKKAEQKTNQTQQAKDPGRAAEVAPKKTRSRKKTATSVRSGGSKKTAKKSGSSLRTKKTDITEQGLLGAFGGGGLQDRLNKAATGSGDLQGFANRATGRSGFSEDRPGEGLGNRLKTDGKGGSGTATVGIGDVGTRQGRGLGRVGSGTGGIGRRSKVNIELGGDDAEFSGSIDREAVKRVVKQNRNAIEYCYNKELSRNSGLYGKLVMEWLIVEGGRAERVVAVRSDSTLKNRNVEKCVSNVIAGLKFPVPPPETQAQVRYPFLFSSR